MEVYKEILIFQLITKSGRVTAYLPNLNAAVNHFRTFSTHYLKDQHITLCSDESSNGNSL